MIAWVGASLPTEKGDGYATSTLPVTALLTDAYRPAGVKLGIPSVVYFFTGKNDDKLLAYEGKLFNDERVGVSSRFFNFIKISLDLMDPATRKACGGDQPSLLLFDGEGKEAKRFEGWNPSAASLCKSLEVLFKVRYGSNLASLLAKEGQILDKLDKIYWDTKDKEDLLAQAREHIAKHDCDRGRREVKELESEIAKFESDRTTLLAEEQELLDVSKREAGAKGSG